MIVISSTLFFPKFFSTAFSPSKESDPSGATSVTSVSSCISYKINTARTAANSKIAITVFE
ncbi:MAG: hypothetical protein Q6356_007980 [Candidatus Wukongarchaeota archaeon]